MTFGISGGRRAAAVLLTTGALLAAGPLVSPAAAATPAPKVTAKGAFLMDSGSGKTVFSKTADTKRQMASTTKTMAVAVVLDTKGVNLDRKVTVKQTYRDYVTKNGASTADLRTGDKLTVRQLLYGAMLPSGCDATYALADTFGTGSTVSARTKSFISKMNAKAKSLKMTNTKFDSFDGISQGGNNYSTPRDLAKLARHALKNSTFRTVVKAASTKQKATAKSGGTRTYTWYNTNKLLGSYKGATGVKTGTGTAAGPCLIFSATKNGKTLVGVILHDNNRYEDAGKMLDHGFGTKTTSTLRVKPLPQGAQQD
ncbi:D-alanyl-D-alanine carboxypeptidase family protein [Streptomyces sp. NPDC058374]|uniref:D-alanyl-D-alanine carboxypeptidase family protein n=1 Tax=Streptomyces sp. NPDC058374 TaxID=3346466 RepID=UPI00366660C5